MQTFALPPKVKRAASVKGVESGVEGSMHGSLLKVEIILLNKKMKASDQGATH